MKINMATLPVPPENLRPQELQAVYAISRVIAQTTDTDSALDQIVKLVRPIFIFDNIVLYRPRKKHTPEPTYARAIGRGRSVEADLAWGEVIATEVLEKEKTIHRQEEAEGPSDDRMRDRLRHRYFLGLPIQISDRVFGALVFIRFGGPPYTFEQIHLAEFIAEHVAQLLEHQRLVERIANLEAERRLAQLQEDFIATVSHDLRTPLGFIKGYATTLLRGDARWDTKTRREFLTIIDEEADRLEELISNLLDSSRLQAGTLQMDFQPVRLETLLKDMVQRAQLGDFDVDIHLDIKTEGIIIQADPTRLVQVFDNLVSNADKYATGSVLTINVDVLDGRAHITFHDTGPGIVKEHLEDIFKRFYRLPEHSAKARGSGLGLFICRQIISAHQGEIFAESVEGNGTVFHINLPCKQSPKKS